MANEEQLAILRTGAKVWNKWREMSPDLMVDLIGADLPGIDLSSANLSGADLRKALLRNIQLCSANLREANLNGVNLNGANLSEADVRGASLRGAYLVKSKLEKADLNRVDFREGTLLDANLKETRLTLTDFSLAKLGNSDFSGAFLLYTIFGNVDLGEIVGLEKVVHEGPSTIGIDTIVKSKGKIPEIFLRGCGLSDADIEYAKLASSGLDLEQVAEITHKIHQTYSQSGIHYYSCFISYSSRDQDFARQLHDDLQNNGVRCWFAPEDMKIGDQIRPRIDQEIRVRDKLLVILSENSVNSEWEGDEVEAALEEESKSNRLVLFPIRLDDTVMSARDDWAAKIKRRRHIGDFSNWKDKASYQKAFERLLRDLKATK